MRFDPILVPARRDEMIARGLWHETTLAQHLAAAVARCPDKIALIDYASDHASDRVDGTAATGPVRLSFRDLDAWSTRIANGLRLRGIGAGDVVSIQLPNCWQFIATVLACSKLGAVMNPLLPIYGERELLFMLGFCEARMLIAPQRLRGHDHAAMVRSLQARLPRLQQLVFLGDDGPDGFETALTAHGDDRPVGASPQRADDVALLMFTSGTTGEPKGVMHTSNTLMSSLAAARTPLAIDEHDVALCAAPMGHMLGLALLCILPLMTRATTVVMAAWDARRALELAAAEGITFAAGATPYLADLLEAVRTGCRWAPGWRLLCCAGAPIPPVLVERAGHELGLTVCSLWGMTEVQAGTVTPFEAGNRLSAIADGKPPEGMSVRIADEHGRALPDGTTGRLLVRGCGVFAGYLKRPDLNAVDAEGWFDTGDLACVVNDAGYVRLNGRTKDLIKRGGISIPVVEVEALIARHAAVASVAIVGYPDDRLGERACAFVVTNPGHALDLPTLQAHLQAAGLTRQYWPERLSICEALPRTPTGKVQKFKLQALARTGQPDTEPRP